MLRIVLFLLTNLAVMALLTIVVKLTGLDVYAYRRGGLNLQALLVLAAVMGMGGSFISLAMSKWMAKMSTGAKVIVQPRNASEQWLVDTVRRIRVGPEHDAAAGPITTRAQYDRSSAGSTSPREPG